MQCSKKLSVVKQLTFHERGQAHGSHGVLTLQVLGLFADSLCQTCQSSSYAVDSLLVVELSSVCSASRGWISVLRCTTVVRCKNSANQDEVMLAVFAKPFKPLNFFAHGTV